MAKKKGTKQKHQKDACEEDTSDEELKTYSTAKACPHVTKAVNLGRVRKALKNVQNLERCKDCNDSSVEKVPNDCLELECEPAEVWLCLQCGYYGCGRMSSGKHAMTHYKTPRSDCHAVVLSTATLSVWCYTCDENVLLETSRSLRECVDFVSKLKGKAPLNHILVNGTNKPVVNSISEAQTNPTEKGDRESSAPKVKQREQSPKQAIKKGVSSSSTLHSIKGLRNLGNTCFYNAVLQNLCQTPWLREELEERSKKSYEWEITSPIAENDNLQTHEHVLKVPLTECYPLTQAFLHFLKQMVKSTSESSKSEVLNPSQLFDQICKKSPQFRGFHQQDSHELLRHLLDGIRNEEIKRQKRAVLKALLKDNNPNDVDEETKSLIKAYGSIVSHTVVDRTFGGQLLSTVLCEECKMSSQVFEPFMDLSLPLAEEKVGRTNKLSKQDEDCEASMYALSKKKDNHSTVSKHQERKSRVQAKKAAKKKNKNLKFTKNNSLEEEKEELENVEDSKKTAETGGSVQDEEEEKRDGDCNDEQSDADIEDNDESENVSLVAECDAAMLDVSPGEDKVYDGVSHGCILDENIEEICSQIKDIRIRRDSDNQDDLLDSVEGENQAVTKRQKSVHTNVLESIADDSENSSNWSHSQSEHQVREWMMRSLTTLKTRSQASSMNCSVNSCLNQFTASELLTGSNKFRCESCTNHKRDASGDQSAVVYSNASKQMLIFSPPAVLTLHLKRFQQTGIGLRKLNQFVEFPQVLDLAPYCSSICLELPHMASVKDEVLYSLYGVVQHRGKLTSGHYTAYIKVQESNMNSSFLNSCPVHHCSLEQLLKRISKVKTTNGATGTTSTDSTKHRWYYISDGFYKEVNESEVLNCQAYILFYQRIK